MDNISDALSNQGAQFTTVSEAIAQYQKDIESLQPTARTTHESLASIYEEFEESVKRGDINNDVSRRQMQELIGEVVSLDEARDWVGTHSGFFQMADEDNLTKDLTSAWSALRSQYNAMTEEE